MLKYWLVSGGVMRRMAWGTTTSLVARPGRRPSARAASVWPAGTALTPERTTSAMKPAV